MRVLGIPVATFLPIIGIAYTIILITLTIWWRPGWRRFGALMVGTFAAALVGPLIEGVAHRAGFWRYTLDTDTLIGPLLFYPLGMLGFFVMGLIAWRIGRRWGMRGQVVFVALITVTGPVRDYFEADRWFNVIRFGSGILPIVWDLFAWFALLSIVIVVSEKIASPSRCQADNANASSRS